jgi:hypothetical protein
MKWLILAIVILAQQPAKVPEGQGSAEGKGAQVSKQGDRGDNQSQIPKQPPLSSTDNQHPTAEIQTAAPNTNSDVEIQGKIKTFTGLLVFVGFLQFFALIGQVVIYFRQAKIMARQAHEAKRSRGYMRLQWKAMGIQAGIMEQQRATMKEQLSQMIASGKQTDDLIKEAISQTQNMDGQLEQMQTQTRLSLRPFVGLDEGHEAIQTTALDIDESGNARLTYVIRAKNYSNVPATNVWAAANLVVADDMNTVYEWQGYACDDAMIGKPDIGQILFPGRDRVFTSMLATAKTIKKHEGSRLQVWLTGGIGYRDQFGYLYRTKFMFMLRDGAGHVVVFDPPRQSTQIAGRFIATGGAIDAGEIPKYNYGQGPYAKNPT